MQELRTQLDTDPVEDRVRTPQRGSLPPQRLKWTVKAYCDAIEKGVFAPTLRAELVNGEIIEKQPIGDLHAYILDCLHALLSATLSGEFVLRKQGSVAISDVSRPEPDLVVLKGPRSRYAVGTPTQTDVVILCEVADASLAYDRTPKLALYANAGIIEYWLINAKASELERYTSPREDGTYASKAVLSRSESLEHEVLGRLELDLLFPPLSDDSAET